MNDGEFKIFVVEDNDWYNKFLVHHLSLNPDYHVTGYRTGADLMKNMLKAPDVVSVDYKLPDTDGKQLMKKIKESYPDTEVIIISEQNEIEVAVELLRDGAYDYIVKGDDIQSRLMHTIDKVRKNRHLKEKVVELEKEVRKKYDLQSSVIGTSPAIQRVHELINKALTTNINVMLTGETGTGKELVAKAIHYSSERKSKPFVPVNVAALPADLIESELFGHEKGSFTGAVARRIGKFEEAHGGTLFLDEIGEMDLVFQTKLLRALQEREITRIGSNDAVKVDCRIITATHRNLKELVKEGKFREDLFYRLMGLPIDLPPLRERGKDVLILAKYFIEAFCKENRMPVKAISSEAQQKLLAYAFPGNIRELKSVMDLAVVLAQDNSIQPDDISLSNFDAVADILTEESTMRQYELRILKAYLAKYNDDVKTVAQKLDISSATIYRMLKE